MENRLQLLNQINDLTVTEAYIGGNNNEPDGGFPPIIIVEKEEKKTRELGRSGKNISIHQILTQRKQEPITIDLPNTSNKIMY